MIQLEKVLCNAKAHTTGGRAGSNAERLFAAAVKLEGHKETLVNAQRRIRRLMGIALLAATTSFAQQVRIDYDRITAFSRYKTYAWEKVHTQNALGSIESILHSRRKAGCRSTQPEMFPSWRREPLRRL
jgi:hypothetical protein